MVAINRSSVLGHICQFIVYAPQEDFTNWNENGNVFFQWKYVYPPAVFFYCILRDIYAVLKSAEKSMISLTRPAWDIGTIFKVFGGTQAQNFEIFSPHTPLSNDLPDSLSPKGSTQSNSTIVVMTNVSCCQSTTACEHSL